jgi:NADH-ubiquinone oxidoreductase chain 2
MEFIDKGLFIYNGYLNVKNFSLIFIIFILLLTLIILGINSVHPRKIWFKFKNNKKINFYGYKFVLNSASNILNKMSDQYRITEYPLIILFCITGSIFLILSSDLISIFLSIELQSYSLYLICSIYRNSELSITAGLTYFLLGGLSSCIILLGISLIYINFGSTNLEYIYIINSISNTLKTNIIHIPFGSNINDILYSVSNINFQHNYLQVTLIIMSIGFLFKISAAPFHFWSPDVYDAIPTIVTIFVAIIPKISILILLYDISYLSLDNDNIMGLSWSNNIVISCILSLVIGSVLGLTQHRIKRLFAYSTISHLGFILLALSINNLESTRAFLFYIIQYSISNLNAFIILIVIGNNLYFYILNNININNKKYSPVQLIYQLKGYFYINPLLSISLILTLFSFVGVPPLIGFFGKQMILISAIDKGYILITLIAIITSIISAVYYLALVKNIFFEKTDYRINDNFFKIIQKRYKSVMHLVEPNVTISSYLSSVISIITLILITFMFFDQELIRLISIIN